MKITRAILNRLLEEAIKNKDFHLFFQRGITALAAELNYYNGNIKTASEYHSALQSKSLPAFFLNALLPTKTNSKTKSQKRKK